MNRIQWLAVVPAMVFGAVAQGQVQGRVLKTFLLDPHGRPVQDPNHPLLAGFQVNRSRGFHVLPGHPGVLEVMTGTNAQGHEISLAFEHDNPPVANPMHPDLWAELATLREGPYRFRLDQVQLTPNNNGTVDILRLQGSSYGVFYGPFVIENPIAHVELTPVDLYKLLSAPPQGTLTHQELMKAAADAARAAAGQPVVSGAAVPPAGRTAEAEPGFFDHDFRRLRANFQKKDYWIVGRY